MKQGLSISSAFINGELFLVAFGGYNGKYSNEVLLMFHDDILVDCFWIY